MRRFFFDNKKPAGGILAGGSYVDTSLVVGVSYFSLLLAVITLTARRRSPSTSSVTLITG